MGSLLDFRPSEIVSDAFSNYTNRLHRARGVHACKRSSVIKRDVDYCSHECGVHGFSPRSLGERKVLRIGRACRVDSRAMR